MCRTTDASRRRLCLALGLGALGLAGLVGVKEARAATEDLPPMPDDDLAEAQQLQQDGKVWQAEAILRQWAQAGQVVAMERLALMHWYGRTLYPGQPWNRELAVYWFGQAAARGSDLGRHMSQVARQSR